MTPPINIDGESGYGNVTIDGQTVEQITIDGQEVLSTLPDSEISKEIDFFERADVLGPYDDASRWAEETSQVFEGNKSLEGTSDGGRYMTFSTSGLNYYPQRGNTIRGYFYGDSSAQHGIIFGNDTSNYYQATMHQHHDNYILLGTESDDENLIDREEGSGGPVDNVWYPWEIEWGSPTITLRVYDGNKNLINEASANDSSYDGGGVFGFINGAGGGSRSYWDLIGIK